MPDERTRRALAEVEEQRDDAVLYLSTIKLVLGVLARGHGLRVCGQEIAEVLVRQLGVETCAIVLADGPEGELALAGFATQSQRLGGGGGDLDEGRWLLLAQLLGTGVEPACFRRVSDGGFVAVAPAELADEGFLVLPFTVAGDPGGALALHSITAPTQAFARSHALALVAEIVGQALGAARSRESVERLCGTLETELGLSRRVSFAKDETLRSREERIARLTDELSRSNRVKTDFLGMVSHELRTPLNAILGYASLMREGVGGPVSDEHSGFLDRVLGSTRHLNTLIDDILFFVQLEADRVLVRSERVRTERLLDQVLAMIPGLPEPEQVQVRIDIDPRVASMQVDGDLVRRVLFHLVGNALKFTSRGEVLIAVRPGEGDAVTITVRDTGVGIAPERLQQVFDLFGQADSSTTRRYNGLGIGLTLIGRCVRLLGGEVTARSEPGVGSEFRVFLPGVLAAAGQAESRPRFLH